MSSETYFPEQGTSQLPSGLLLAKVGNYISGVGATLIFDGQTAATTKRYKRLSTYTPSSGARVLVAKIGGSYVILGAVVS